MFDAARFPQNWITESTYKIVSCIRKVLELICMKEALADLQCALVLWLSASLATRGSTGCLYNTSNMLGWETKIPQLHTVPQGKNKGRAPLLGIMTWWVRGRRRQHVRGVVTTEEGDERIMFFLYLFSPWAPQKCSSQYKPWRCLNWVTCRSASL